MGLALFDLDNTLLSNDSDYLWGCFLVERGLVDSESYEVENKRFFQDYTDGCLDIRAYLTFQLGILAQHRISDLNRWRLEFIAEKIQPIIAPGAKNLLAQHRQRGDTLMIITATNRFVTAPIAELLAVPYLLATEAEIRNGQYTGQSEGVPCFQEGKVTRLKSWLASRGETLAESCFYSDSHNDLPLLEMVERPVAVDADERLRRHAKKKGWEIISLRK